MRFFKRRKPPDPEKVERTREAKRESYTTLRRYAEVTGDSRLLSFIEERERVLASLSEEYSTITHGEER
jgi:hypothetical protein